MPASVGYLSRIAIHCPRLNFGDAAPVLKTGVALVAFGAAVEAGGLRSAFVTLPSGPAVGAAGPAAPSSGTALTCSPSSGAGPGLVPRVRMNADTATIAATAPIAAPIVLWERCGLRAVSCLRLARADGLRWSTGVTVRA